MYCQCDNKADKVKLVSISKSLKILLVASLQVKRNVFSMPHWLLTISFGPATNFWSRRTALERIYIFVTIVVALWDITTGLYLLFKKKKSEAVQLPFICTTKSNPTSATSNTTKSIKQRALRLVYKIFRNLVRVPHSFAAFPPDTVGRRRRR